MANSNFVACLKQAEKGNLDAQCDLGAMYANGVGVPQDYEKALKWTRKAASKGHSLAQHNLGILLPKSAQEAVIWGQEAAKNGGAEAQWALGCAYADCHDFVNAMAWHRKAAEQGYVKSQTLVGLMYDYGRGVQRDYAQAVFWYRKAAEQWDKEAQYQLGLMYEKEKNHSQAIAWYYKAASQSHPDALSKVRQLPVKPQQADNSDILASSIVISHYSKDLNTRAAKNTIMASDNNLCHTYRTQEDFKYAVENDDFWSCVIDYDDGRSSLTIVTQSMKRMLQTLMSKVDMIIFNLDTGVFPHSQLNIFYSSKKWWARWSLNNETINTCRPVDGVLDSLLIAIDPFDHAGRDVILSMFSDALKKYQN